MGLLRAPQLGRMHNPTAVATNIPCVFPSLTRLQRGGGRRTQRRSTEERTEEHGVVHHRAVSQDELVAGSRHYGQD